MGTGKWESWGSRHRRCELQQRRGEQHVCQVPDELVGVLGTGRRGCHGWEVDTVPRVRAVRS